MIFMTPFTNLWQRIFHQIQWLTLWLTSIYGVLLRIWWHIRKRTNQQKLLQLPQKSIPPLKDFLVKIKRQFIQCAHEISFLIRLFVGTMEESRKWDRASTQPQINRRQWPQPEQWIWHFNDVCCVTHNTFAAFEWWGFSNKFQRWRWVGAQKPVPKSSSFSSCEEKLISM